MKGVLGIAEQVFLTKLVTSETPVSENKKIGMNFIFITGFFVALAFLILLYAAYLYIERTYNQEIALVFVGGAALTIAGLNALVGYSYYRYKRNQVLKLKQDLIDIMEDALEYIDDELAQPVKDYPKASIAISAIAGFMSGERFL